ncbi:MAG: hypothetical protein V2B15_05790 [Bacteroidota bacterium]
MMNSLSHAYGRMVLFALPVLFMLVLKPATVHGQYSSNSLYSLYGIGDLVPNSSAKTSGLGRTGLALRSEGFLNTLNPASYTAFGTNDVLIDAGFSGYYSTYESRGQLESATDMNLDHFSLGFPVTKWWGAIVGLSPFSEIGYDIITSSVFEGSLDALETRFTGSGGISRFYFSNSFFPVEQLSFGINISYLMGTLEQTETSKLSNLGFYDFNTLNKFYLRNFYVGFGLLYDQALKDDHLSLGITFYPRQILSAKYTHEISVSGDEETILYRETESVHGFDLPGAFNAGICYDVNSKFKIIADYGLQRWSGNSALIDVISYTDRYSYRFGLEYLPNPIDPLTFFQKVEYRLGAYCENSYILMRENRIKDYGITIGLGIPLQNRKSKINFSLELGQLGTLSNGLVRERYAGFSLDFALSDIWFRKRKFE